MQSVSPPTVQPNLAKVATLTGWVLVGFSLITLCGWAFHISVMRSFVPAAVPIKANSAVVLMFVGLALLRRDHPDLQVLCHLRSRDWSLEQD